MEGFNKYGALSGDQKGSAKATGSAVDLNNNEVDRPWLDAPLVPAGFRCPVHGIAAVERKLRLLHIISFN